MQPLKHLLQCPLCARQYDVEGLDAGSRFHCSCGEVLETASVTPRDSAVVRCSACGGARTGSEERCGYCQADFTVHERDLVAICPGCATRLPRSARFCHSCGDSIDLSASRPGGPSDRTCPKCGPEASLRSRRLGEIGAAGPEGRLASRQLGAVLECPRCAGLWIAAEAFTRLEGQARANAVLDESLLPPTAIPPPPRGKAEERLYRPCVTCGNLMQRRNYARRSGVILDVCREHGIWFDERELDSILEWIRRGGWERESKRRAVEEKQEADRLARQRRRAASTASSPVSTTGWLDGIWMFAVLAEVLDGIFDL